MKRNLLALVGTLGMVGVAALAPGQAFAEDSVSYQAALSPVTANKVTGTGASWITISGHTAEVKIQVSGLLDGSPHIQHLHIDGQGTCPTEAQQHNGQPSITHSDGTPLYGTIATSFTVTGDSSPAAAMSHTDFPSTGSYTYARTIELDDAVIASLQKGTAVLVVHGIDYNGNGVYDDVLGRSELDPNLPAEATDPALCGNYTLMQMAGVPDGAAETGGGSTAPGSGSGVLGAVGAAALLAAGGVAVIAYRRRPTSG